MADGSKAEPEEEAGAGAPQQSRARRIGRRVGQAVYYALVVSFATTATWQITRQVFFPTPPAAPLPYHSCEEGLRALLGGIADAKHAADTLDADQNEEAALKRFRFAISKTWAHRDGVEGLCREEDHKRLLDAMERLRYSEEHGVRKQAAELTALRRRVGEMAAELLPRSPTE